MSCNKIITYSAHGTEVSAVAPYIKYTASAVAVVAGRTVNGPAASAGGPYVAGCQGLVTKLQLDGSTSNDPGGGTLVYAWSSDCPGASFDNSSSTRPMLSIIPSSVPLTCNVTLFV